MKKTTIIAAVLVSFCFSLHAQKSAQINGSVTKSFNGEFKSASNVRWEKISNDIFMVRFDYQEANSIAYFDKKGELLMTGQTVSFDQTPESVQHGIQEIMKLYELKNGGLSVLLTYQLEESGAIKYYVNCGNKDFLLSAMSTPKGKVTVLREVKLDSVQGDIPQLISIR
jgi:hypothetical protein